ncbi:PREDICTED: V-type proton ATPase subunit G 1-like isoform 2 [Odobenus rosmarus divergens]|uniref:V-type proton ATPase subunit G 1-like isoform 2 n=1 Tax=Odobenus rosmarus divergens TaxID=9708 RepID=A0A9B0HFL3_ODORO
MASQSQGIQQLLQAEKRAAEKRAAGKVSEAHKRKNRRLKQETQEKMTILQAYFQQNRDEVLDNLLAFVCDIRPEIHENYRINGKGRKEQLCVQIGMLDAVMEYEASAKLE